MIPKKALEIVDKTLRDVSYKDEPFGGKLIVLGGDFRQILPVVKRGFRNTFIEETIKNSFLWLLFNISNLKINIRTQNKEFASFLLDIGEGLLNPFLIPNHWITNDVCNDIYKNINNNYHFSQSVILSSHNEEVNMLNNKILNLINSEAVIYYSIDHATHKGVDQTDENIHLNYPIEMLNNIREGLPPHKIILKVNAIIMLIRNLSIVDGLCNGTRLKVTKLYKYNIEAEIINENKGNKVFIPRITLNTCESSSLPFILYRKQFPIILAFAITINKSQGQNIDNVGIYIKKSLFTHGQLYVALSRCKNPNNICIQNETENIKEIPNIVWNEILNK